MIPYEAILKGEVNDSRFEKFCQALLQKSEGVTIVPTSASWDQGRDGISIRPSSGSHSEVLCCTITDKIDGKVISDAQRLAETKTTPHHVYYCFSLDLSDHRRDELAADFRVHLKGTYSVSMLGAKQLASIAERFPELFRDFYHAEVRGAEASYRPSPLASSRLQRLVVCASHSWRLLRKTQRCSDVR